MLPSIHEMFPDYLIPPSSLRAFPHNEHLASAPKTRSRTKGKNRAPQSAIGLDMDLRIRNWSAGTGPPDPGYAGRVFFPPSSFCAADGDDGDTMATNSGKYICPTCGKQFNRPSGLRIHLTAHSGETPFHCPWPNCGRGFNVKSNMRRHYRNHTDPQYRSRPPSAADVNRGRRGKGPFVPGYDHAGEPSMPSSLPESQRNQGRSASNRSNAFAHEYADDDVSDASVYQDEEVLQTSILQPKFSTHGLVAHRSSFDPASTTSRSSSTVSSPSPSPPPSNHAYTVSSVYAHTFADPRVSTTLRPAFV